MRLPGGAPESVTAEGLASSPSRLNDVALYDLVYQQVFSLTGGGHHRDLEDLVQIAAMAVICAYPSFEGRSALSTFTYRICYRTVIQQNRWYKRWLRRFAWSRDGMLPEPWDGQEDAGEQLVDWERVERLRGALARLSAKHRAVVVLRDLDGLGIAEIAEIVDATENTVRSRLRDGRKDLSRALKGDSYFGDGSCKENGGDS